MFVEMAWTTEHVDDTSVPKDGPVRTLVYINLIMAAGGIPTEDHVDPDGFRVLRHDL